MRRIRIVGLCLVAAFALSAVVASAAQAEGPEWGHCLAQKKGEYTEGNCKTKSAKAHKGKFEWFPGGGAACYPLKHGEYTDSSCTSKSGKPHKGKFEKTAGGKFTGVGGKGKLWAAARFECEGGSLPGNVRQPCGDVLFTTATAVECTSESASGEATGTSGLANVKVTFRGCILLGTIPCSTQGAASGEVVVNTMKGELGYIDKAKKEVGVLLEPATPKGNFAVFHCFSEAEETNSVIAVGVGNETEGTAYQPESTGGNDGIISPITPVDAMTSTFTQAYTVYVSPGSQNEEVVYNLPTKFESGPVTALEMFIEAGEAYEKGENTRSSQWSPAGEEVTNVSTPEGAAEIKA
jgi:hypothetical protein